MTYYVYILTTRNNTALYTGVTSDLLKRVMEHKGKKIEGYTRKYHVDKLVFYEAFEDVRVAISREKQIKAGSRQKKTDLVRGANRKWHDLTPSL